MIPGFSDGQVDAGLNSILKRFLIEARGNPRVMDNSSLKIASQ